MARTTTTDGMSTGKNNNNDGMIMAECAIKAQEE
jgi:hypothetical protein